MQDIFERWNQFLLLEKSVSATESLHIYQKSIKQATIQEVFRP
jgi:hypothetical protein